MSVLCGLWKRRDELTQVLKLSSFGKILESLALGIGSTGGDPAGDNLLPECIISLGLKLVC